MASFGEELRQQRELREISLDEIAESTKVNRRFLEALERDDFEALPGGLFTRGFIRAYAAHVGLDVDATVNAYLYQVEQEADEGSRRQRHSGAPRLEQEKEPGRERDWMKDRRVQIALAAILLLVLLWLLFW